MLIRTRLSMGATTSNVLKRSITARGDAEEVTRGPGYVGLRHNIAKLKERPPFTVGGMLDISACPEFLMHIVNKNKTSFKCCNIRRVDVEQVQSLCVPSAFNDLVRQEWKVDPSVRLAAECPAERLRIFSDNPNHSFESNFHDILKDDLFMDTYSNIEMVLNKLNIYSVGGHFTAHKDSSRVDPERYLGTLIVALHFEHTGGELYVRNEGQETVYDFSQRSADSKIVQFAAFIGDCEHEVKPVTSGHRVVLTYTLLRPVEILRVLPSGAKLLTKTVSDRYIPHSAEPIPTLAAQVDPPVTTEDKRKRIAEAESKARFGSQHHFQHRCNAD